MKRNILIIIIFVINFSLILSCSNDDNNVIEDDDVEIIDDPNDDVFAGEILINNEELREDSFLLVEDAFNNQVFLMDREARVYYEWTLSSGLGNDIQLLPNGQLLALLEADDAVIQLGGNGGKVQFINPDNTIAWEYNYSSEDYISHHDVELLPNGNVLFLVWERKIAEQAVGAGYENAIDIFPEAIIEIDYNTKEIAWEWHSWDHLIQDFDPARENYGTVSDHPELVNINYNPVDSGDIMHANGITYDEENDIIYMSVNAFSEVWVIDHSTTSEEAASHSGGNYDKGGDLIYRFGNPEAYDNNQGERLFYNNHYPNLLHNSPTRNMLIFGNGNNVSQSTAYELQLPDVFNLLPNTNNEPQIVWSFTDPDLYSPKVSGAVRLANGNTLITEGDFGIWEVTDAGEVVWKFQGDGFFWRTYSFDKNSTQILNLPED